ncbi:hypothetical protein BC834DRAFT_841030 [Gloeopeniophorella convolvens]|nr:hypothetical protein BC834DRAFT_841030 [Gloeopeniophorella convolvens]
MPTQPPSPVISSSSTLWATASKEWVIPAKPKPGRKPKKDPVPTSAQQEEVSDAKGRRVQNRAAQRAFRERKQSQLAELQARIQLYEQGEIERNVALQAAAKRLKEENERLHTENVQLKERVAAYERDRAAQKATDAKRWRDVSSSSLEDQDLPNKKRSRLAVKTASAFQVPTPPAIAFSPSPPSLVSSPGSNVSSENGFSPLPVRSPNQGDVMFSSQVQALDGIFNFHPKAPVFSNSNAIDSFECGFCVDGASCVCREMALHPLPEAPFKIEAVEPAAPLVQVSLPAAPQPNGESILDNLPAYQPPVPLRRRPAVRTLKSLFPVVPLTSSPSRSASTAPAECSGDPSNCLACADDVFGQAFCAAVGESLASSGSCANCPDGSQCSGAGPSAPREDSGPSETIPTSDAWRQLKSHPNVSFADLTLLAEVVARRSKCTGPTVVISPPPGSLTPERPASPADATETPVAGVDDNAVLLSDPHAHYRMKEQERSAGSPPRLAPQEELIQCARSRSVREVHAAGLREALALLDSRF